MNGIVIPCTITAHPVSINYDRSLEDSIKAGNYCQEDYRITSKNFPSSETGIKDIVVELFYYNKDMDTYEIIDDWVERGYRAATIKELLALGEKYPDLQRELPIIALGSVCQSPDGTRYCSFLSGDGSRRRLSLGRVGNRQNSHCWLAVVRK